MEAPRRTTGVLGERHVVQLVEPLALRRPAAAFWQFGDQLHDERHELIVDEPRRPCSFHSLVRLSPLTWRDVVPPGGDEPSSTIIGYNRFVRPFWRADVPIMITYHAGQLLLILGLIAVG